VCLVIKVRSFNSEIIGYINVFESITKTNVKDCYVDKHLVFIVEQGEIGKAIGKNGSNVKRVSNLFKKSVKIVEFNKNVEEFVKNLILPIKSKAYKEGEGVVVLELGSVANRASVLGKNRRNIKELNEIVKKYFNVEVKIK